MSKRESPYHVVAVPLVSGFEGKNSFLVFPIMNMIVSLVEKNIPWFISGMYRERNDEE